MPSAIQSCPILSFRDRHLAKKADSAHSSNGISAALQIFTQLRPIIVYIYTYTIVACAFKWKSSVARSAFNLTAETQGLSSKVHIIGTTELMRPGGTSAQTSRFISIA